MKAWSVKVINNGVLSKDPTGFWGTGAYDVGFQAAIFMRRAEAERFKELHDNCGTIIRVNITESRPKK